MLTHIPRYAGMAVTALMIVASGFATASASERAFKGNCSKCHTRPSSVARSFDGNEEQRRKAFDRFLSTHYAEDPQVRAKIIDYLLTVAR